MESGKRSYYAIIPANVRYDKNLKANSKLLYGEITALCNEKGYCWASNSYFAELYGVSKKSISLWIKELIERNYISSKLIYKEGSNEIKDRYLQIVPYPMEEKVYTPMEEKVIDNNTYINNTFNNTFNKNIMSCKQDDAIPYSEIIDYLNLRTGSSYRHTTKKTKDLIKARFNEKFTLDDFKTVIDKKTIEWINKPDMVGFLRPETLFGTKFESYLNQQLKKPVDKYDALNELIEEENNNDFTGIF